MTLTTQKEIRSAFWQGMPYAWVTYRGKTQNQIPVDIRMEFVDFVDHLQKTGIISEELAVRHDRNKRFLAALAQFHGHL